MKTNQKKRGPAPYEAKGFRSGFTIIETMISISLFLVVIMAGMDALLNANVIQQKSQDMRSILDNLSFIMEDMSKNLRTGYSYYCITGGDNLSNVATVKSGQNCWGIAFEPTTGSVTNNNDQWVYYFGTGLAAGKIFKSTQGPYFPSAFVQLNPDEIVLDSASGFSVLGTERPPDSAQQPLVTIRLSGKITITSKNIVTPFALQTSVSQRLIDILP